MTNDATSDSKVVQPPETPPPPPGDGTPAVPAATKDATPSGVKMIPETDLLAAKKDWEGKVEAATKEADAHKTKLSEVQQQFLQASAKLEELEAKQGTVTATAEEVTAAKQEAEAAKGQLTEANAKLLEARRTLVAQQYGVPVDTLKEKNLEELGHFEEALKAVATTRGIGNYATGGVGVTPAPKTNFERAKEVVEAAPTQGVRNAPPPNQPPPE